MKSKFNLAALALAAAFVAMPSGANAGFVGHDKFWADVDAHMHRLMSLSWLCPERAVAHKHHKHHKHRHMK
jgi:hypothetical protein